MATFREQEIGARTVARLRKAFESHPMRGKRLAIVAPMPDFVEPLCRALGAECTAISLGDATSRPLARRPFDAAVAGPGVSRAGLGEAGRFREPDGDLAAMRELAEVVDADGLLFLMVPLGKDDVSRDGRRTYGKGRAPRLLQDWEMVNSIGYDRRQRRRLESTDDRYQPVLVLRNRPESEVLLLEPVNGRDSLEIRGGVRSQLIFDLAVAPGIESHFAPGELINARIGSVPTPVKLRAGTSDLQCFNEIILAQDYDFELPAMDPRLIIDGGANVGYSSVQFSNRYPGSRVIAVEAERANFDLLSENVAGYPNVEGLHAAIWHRPARLKIRDSNAPRWSFQVEETDQKSDQVVTAVTLGDLLAGSGHDEIDLLKLDIEGAEKAVFSSNYETWLPRTRIILIEIHDDIPGCKEAVLAALERYDYRIVEKKGRYARNHCAMRRDLL